MKKSGKPNNNFLIIIIVVSGLLLALAVILLVRSVLDPPNVTETSASTLQTSETSIEVTTTLSEQTEDPDITETTTQTEETSAPVTEHETTGTSEETTAEIRIDPDEAEILGIIHRGELLALELFAAAFEIERNEGEKEAFSEIKPLLLEYWSESIVDEALAPFYEEYLDIWGYEMMYYFPLASEECVFQCFTEIVSWSDEEIIVEFFILDEMEDESFFLHVVLVPSENGWVINDRYSPGW